MLGTGMMIVAGRSSTGFRAGEELRLDEPGTIMTGAFTGALTGTSTAGGAGALEPAAAEASTLFLD